MYAGAVASASPLVQALLERAVGNFGYGAQPYGALRALFPSPLVGTRARVGRRVPAGRTRAALKRCRAVSTGKTHILGATHLGPPGVPNFGIRRGQRFNNAAALKARARAPITRGTLAEVAGEPARVAA